MKLRLAIVISHPIQHFCPLYAAWAASPHWDIHVFFGSRFGLDAYKDKDFGETISWSGLPLDEFPHSFLNGDALIHVDRALDAQSLNARLDTFAPHAVLTYGYAQRLQRRAQAWAKENGRCLLFFSDSELRHHRPLWTRMVKRIVLPRVLNQVDWVIVTGNANEEYYRLYGVPPNKFIRGSYPIDVKSYGHALANRSRLRAAARGVLGIADDEFVICSVGKLVEWKRQLDVIRAVGTLQPHKAVGLIVGSGVMREQWQKAARSLSRNRVIFTGFTPPEGLPELYAAADVYVHASSKEPHSVAISEAAYMGLPLVISDRCGSYGVDDDVRPGVNGFVYPCGDTKRLAAYLTRLMTDKPLYASMAAQSRQIAGRQQRVTYDELPGTLKTLVES